MIFIVIIIGISRPGPQNYQHHFLQVTLCSHPTCHKNKPDTFNGFLAVKLVPIIALLFWMNRMQPSNQWIVLRPLIP